jgi:DNA-binding NtrC family response regulator
MNAPILMIVDDEESVRSSLRARFTRQGCTVIEGSTAAEALMRISREVDLVMLDFPLPDGDGLQALQRMKELAPDTVIVLMTAVSSLANAVEAMQHGADDYVSKPFDLDTVTVVVAHALERIQLRRVVRASRVGKGREYGFDVIVGASPGMVAVKSLLARVAGSPITTVLLTGETGTGKRLAAAAIHYNSDRATQRFIDVTCSTGPQPRTARASVDGRRRRPHVRGRRARSRAVAPQHGAYQAPDWTADWLHREATTLLEIWSARDFGTATPSWTRSARHSSTRG